MLKIRDDGNCIFDLAYPLLRRFRIATQEHRDFDEQRGVLVLNKNNGCIESDDSMLTRVIGGSSDYREI